MGARASHERTPEERTIVLLAGGFCRLQRVQEDADALRGEHRALQRSHSLLVPGQLGCGWYEQAVKSLQVIRGVSVSRTAAPDMKHQVASLT